MAHQYEVIVGNIGTVHSGTNKREAMKVYREYVDDSKANYGRAAGEDVTLMMDSEPEKEYQGEISRVEGYAESWLSGNLNDVADALVKESPLVCREVRLRIPENPDQRLLLKMLAERQKPKAETRPSKSAIGEVVVWRGEPPDGNPYGHRSGSRGVCGLMDEERVESLRRFRDGGDTSEYTFWHAPCGGGARRIASRDEIDWTGMRPRQGSGL